MKLTVQDVARIFLVSEKTVYRWISQGELPAYRINEQYRFNRTELIEWAIGKRINFSHELFEEPESANDLCPSLKEALANGGVFYRLGGSDKESVLRELVSVIRLPDNIDQDFLLKVLLARENLGTTAIGEGIAIPHARMPLVLHVSQPTVALCFLDHPVEFGALDGKPVHTLFTIISPTIRGHLNLLSKLSYMLRDETFRCILEKQGNRSEILEHVTILESKIPSSSPVATAQ